MELDSRTPRRRERSRPRSYIYDYRTRRDVHYRPTVPANGPLYPFPFPRWTSSHGSRRQQRARAIRRLRHPDAPTEVWGNHFTARIAPAAINLWLSGFFSRDVQLRWVGPQLTRRVKRHADVPLSFADGYPYLLANEASLRDVQQRCPASVKMEQFRPNLVVSGADAWAEDTESDSHWRRHF